VGTMSHSSPNRAEANQSSLAAMWTSRLHQRSNGRLFRQWEQRRH
jgi:hypothetical protein